MIRRNNTAIPQRLAPEHAVAERTIKANGIDLWTEDFGDRRNPPVLLIMGASAQGIYWPEDFVQQLVAAGRYVIRYDNRDTGQSTCFDFAAHPYTLDDMAADATGLLDAYDLPTAHVVGASMGGMIVQVLALRHRQRLRTATMIMSSPFAAGIDPDHPDPTNDLPGPSEAWMREILTIQMQPATTQAARIDQRVELFRKLTGSRYPFDAAGHRAIAEREVARAANFAAMNNHPLAINATLPRDRRPLLKKLTIPALVIHGTEDPILPYPHGVALANSIAGARLLTMDGVGHDMPAAVMPQIIAAIVAITKEGNSP
jgi:pimeloyl-ACP methyl ester carboxylesterase